jgi:hypothetical protein
MEIWEPKPPGALWATPACYGTVLRLLDNVIINKDATKVMQAKKITKTSR